MRAEIKRLPEPFLLRLKSLFPSHKYDAFVNLFSETRLTTFRINTLKVNQPQVEEALQNAGLRMDPVHWCPGAFILKGGTLRELQDTDAYRNGHLYVQSLSSMVPPLVLNPMPGERVLDMTAAPGSKTTQMACMMQNQGEIVANDNNRIRFFKLKANLDMQGVSNATLKMKYGEAFGKQMPDTFDRILLDAPCSAEGRFHVDEPQSYRFWKPRKVIEMASKQKRLMYSAISALKPGGLLVYSTCTFAPEENEGVLSWALAKFDGLLETEQVTLSFPNQMAGIARWERETFHPGVVKSVRILPNVSMEGFYVAKLRKKNR